MKRADNYQDLEKTEVQMSDDDENEDEEEDDREKIILNKEESTILQDADYKNWVKKAKS